LQSIPFSPLVDGLRSTLASALRFASIGAAFVRSSPDNGKRRITDQRRAQMLRNSDALQ
jgi:hypothetical protein